MRREARATARLSHPGIVRIYDMIDCTESGDRIALVMELLYGRTLAALLDDRTVLTVDETIALALPLLSAVAHAHGAGIIHRDLKPENVFLAVEPDGVVTPKILDFGISKMRPGPDTGARRRSARVITRDGEMLGTPSYMSPEQARGKEVDARSDLFNIGILLYEMLSGRRPFGGEGVHSAIVSTLEEAPRPIEDVPPALWDVLARALAKAPDDRFGSADEVADALRAAMGLPSRASLVPSEPRVTFAPPKRRTPPPMERRWPLAASAAAAALLAAVTGATLALWTTDVPTVRRGYEPTSGIVAAHAAPAPTALTTNKEGPVGAGDPATVNTVQPASTTPRPRPTDTPTRRVMLARDPGF